MNRLTTLRYRRLAIVGAATAALAISGCMSSGSSTPSAPLSAISFDQLCNDHPGAPSTLTAAKALPLNAQREQDIADLSTMCAVGAPTNAFAGLVDGLTVYAMLKRDFPALKLK